MKMTIEFDPNSTADKQAALDMIGGMMPHVAKPAEPEVPAEPKVAKKKASKKKAAAKQDLPPPPGPTFDDVRSAMTAYVQREGKEAAIAILSEYNAAKISALDESDWQTVIDRVA